MIRVTAFGLVFAAGIFADGARAEVFDTFRINVPYQITLGTDKFKAARIECQLEDNTRYWHSNNPGPHTPLEHPSVLIELGSGGAASGQVTFEFRRSSKYVRNDPDYTLSFEEVRENYVVVELYTRFPEHISQYDWIQFECKILELVDQSGARFKMSTNSRHDYVSRSDDADTFTLSSDSRRFRDPRFRFSDNEYRSILSGSQPSASTQLSPAAVESVGPGANASLQQLLESMNSSGN